MNYISNPHRRTLDGWHKRGDLKQDAIQLVVQQYLPSNAGIFDGAVSRVMLHKS
jgi:hypothetical protein